MAELITLARPYAKAAFERAKAQQALAEWAEVLNAAGQVAADEATRQLLTDPGLAEQKKADVILDCTGKSVSEEQRNFLTILADNRRLALLPEIATLFNSFRADLERTIDINVSSAFELTAEQQQKLAEALSRKLDRNVQIEAAVDKSLIGGLVVRTGDLVIDASVRGKLTKLAESLGS
ncbi:F0F1 ATP synthase subunit delta [Halopseudomonas aestusnigri]|jgi:F-type H+-transporting ATPase subunit delta|uniref:F0F1 ATP synthase subunit delta n=1 Tax=Halopseudomonas TaxID=2901189 RepID=UPI000C90C134|nr:MULTISPECIES: F0F1 ATP synthase subunit delta [Halopseudomonas]MAH01477.1 F0F1 ATP synthase subunit delta [Pseudomonadales bacterium]MEE2798874.1 F0F1 ATP synthase subunit delta [Pseudomonadota bacterium]HBT58841.1 F0F1 ATP synthase subunit delta [Pseudomonas sp.]MAH01586.1 F0F1 ATP synthase subunit delta [Pseudomonadales bacterium]MAP78129.1 F0F1 ATP synthase subunit delta [Pseudomonadales bacterium]|tara:strand:- start:2568 stop:3104 length:537 start_codon:yes stop_codon:yes gene_type:complete